MTNPTDYNFRLKDCLIGAQMLFVAFGSLVLVPLLTGLDTNVALFTAGVGTLLFQFITKRKVPIFLASSFAFIAPIIYGIGTWGIPATMGGLMVSGLLYVAMSFLIKKKGPQVLDKYLPAIVTGPVIMVIGLTLAPTAVGMALGRAGATQVVPQDTAIIVSMISLGTTVVVSVFGKGILRLVPILCGISAGYIASYFFGIIDFTPVQKAPWFALPNFVTPTFNLEAIIFILPVAIAPMIEHVGDMLAISTVADKNYIKDPGIHRTLMGDGFATCLASFLGGPPNTTYSEVTGAVALTRAFNPAIMTWAAFTAILLALVSKLGVFLQTIPVPVMGGIMVLLFGSIAAIGMNSLVRAQNDLTQPRNLAIVALILVFGIGGMVLQMGEYVVKGIGLAGILGVVLNLVLPQAPGHKVN